jgi:hypothetical protein
VVRALFESESFGFAAVVTGEGVSGNSGDEGDNRAIKNP